MDDSLHTLSSEEQSLLSSWEEIYMRGHFTLWVLFAIRSGNDNAQEIIKFIQRKAPTIQVNEQSLYRALRRYDEAGLIDVASGITKKHKKYTLSKVGNHVLAAFIQRNLTPLQHIINTNQ